MRFDKFGKGFAHRVKAARPKPGNTWHLDEMFVTLRGEPYLLWRAVDEHGAELHQHRIVSYVTVTLRSKSSSSMSRKLDWKRKYQRTAQLMTPAEKR